MTYLRFSDIVVLNLAFQAFKDLQEWASMQNITPAKNPSEVREQYKKGKRNDKQLSALLKKL